MKNTLFLLLAGLLLYAFWWKFGRVHPVAVVSNGVVLNPSDSASVKSALDDWAVRSALGLNGMNSFRTALRNMSAQELLDVWNLVFTYHADGTRVKDLALADRLRAISKKYNIFT